ncbi:helix-turn-helix domain-containing protein [Pararcticibacter amylolyticus]|uniref:AraC family transcriptional regulator n=1 Tax=Pararcticibacter amylolyticus TaxID=2173175 RepID=A0A2U2PM11_9SPHI|nr:AraC family transcriptional regulator [Pararcticibacter amylolyticus]PWG82441.1 AraC family transcriptional regulator [Pararcticibacter amylolyticus]
MISDSQQPLVFNSISELMRRLGLPRPKHPLISLINYDQAKISPSDAGRGVIIDFYKISFKTSFKGKVKYGPGYYDFAEGGMAFLAPNQLVAIPEDEESYEGYALFFHPDLIRGYPLASTIHHYGFFSYAVSEALFLSDKEKLVISGLFDAIAAELENNIDQFSQGVLVSQIDLLLNHSDRFYNRQFLTRKTVNNDQIDKMHIYLSQRLHNGTTLASRLPSPQEIADYLKVSPRYLSDMLKALTGKTTQQHIHLRLIDEAKELLCTRQLTTAEIAYRLGFEHPQSFNKLFKQKTGLSPAAFRQSFTDQ